MFVSNRNGLSLSVEEKIKALTVVERVLSKYHMSFLTFRLSACPTNVFGGSPSPNLANGLQQSADFFVN